MAKDHGAAEVLGRIITLPDDEAIASPNWLSGIMPVDEYIPDASTPPWHTRRVWAIPVMNRSTRSIFSAV